MKLSLNIWGGTQTQSKTGANSGDKNLQKLINGTFISLHNQNVPWIVKMNPYEFCDLWIMSAPQPPSQNKWFFCFWLRLLFFPLRGEGTYPFTWTPLLCGGPEYMGPESVRICICKSTSDTMKCNSGALFSQHVCICVRNTLKKRPGGSRRE